MYGEKATPQLCAAFAERYGLNKPIPVQFGIYVADVFRGDLGESMRFGRPITDMLGERLPVTVELAISALLFSTFFGVILGIIAAWCRPRR